MSTNPRRENIEAARARLIQALGKNINGSVAQAWIMCRVAAANLGLALETKDLSQLRKELKDDYQMRSYLLRCYCRPENWDENGNPREPLPLQFAYGLANQLDYLLAGQMPEEFDVLVRQGRAGMGPHERRDIAHAAVYVGEAKNGEIADPHPIKTISEWFGVATRTAMRWRNNFNWVKPSDLLHGIPKNQQTFELIERTKKAGARYKKVGRGATANAIRDAKRRNK